MLYKNTTTAVVLYFRTTLLLDIRQQKMAARLQGKCQKRQRHNIKPMLDHNASEISRELVMYGLLINLFTDQSLFYVYKILSLFKYTMHRTASTIKRKYKPCLCAFAFPVCSFGGMGCNFSLILHFWWIIVPMAQRVPYVFTQMPVQHIGPTTSCRMEYIWPYILRH